LTLVEVEHISSGEIRDLAIDLADAEQAVRGAIDDYGLDGPVRKALEAGWEDYVERVDAAKLLRPLEAERRLSARFWRIVGSRGEVSRIKHHRVRVAFRSATKRIPGLQPLVRKLRRP
jgi:hypothetical protein